MPRIKRYQKSLKPPPNQLHPLTILTDQDELMIGDNCYIVANQTVREMNITYLPEVEQDGNALLCHEGLFYCWDGNDWVLSEKEG